MVTIRHTQPVRRSAAHAFDVVIRHNQENHPRWEDEVLEVRPLTDGPVRVGSRSVMVRRERGRTREVVNEVVEYVDGQRVAYQHRADGGPMDFHIRFEFVPTGADTSEVRSTVTMTPHGAFVLMSPLLKLGGPRRSARISERMASVIEDTPAYAH